VRVAFKVAGAALVIDVTVTPAALVSARVSVGVAAATVADVVVVPVPVVPVVPGVEPLPPPQPVSAPNKAARQSDDKYAEMSCLKKARVEKFCTPTSPVT